jgi:putative nucleotidyltransferase with HDIG domain
MFRAHIQESRPDKERTGFPTPDCESIVSQVPHEDTPQARTSEISSDARSTGDAALDHPLRNPSWITTADALMAALSARDHETNGHAERVVSFSQRLGRQVGLSRQEMVALELGARLHDIGKIAVPDSILRKPAELDIEEWQKMREHPARGAKMVRNLGLPEGAALVVAQHHERWDGTGYPGRLAGEDIFLPARIFSVIDAFDAITSDRVYRPGAPYEEALRRISTASETQFDPRVVAAFRHIPPFDWKMIRIVCANESEPQLTQRPHQD